MRNTFEKKINQELKKLLKGKKLLLEYETERIPYTLNYIPDFIITAKDGTKIYIECKGYFRPEHKTKMISVKRQYPELDIRMIFYANRKRDIKWAEKHKFPYAIGSVPEEWFKC